MIGGHLNIIPDNQKEYRMNELSDVWPNGLKFESWSLSLIFDNIERQAVFQSPRFLEIISRYSIDASD